MNRADDIMWWGYPEAPQTGRPRLPPADTAATTDDGPLPCRAERACVRRPTHILTANRRSLRRDDTELRPRDCWPRKRPHRFRQANAACDLSIRGRLACGDFRQCLPDTLLECRTPHVQRKLEPNFWRFDKTDDARDQNFVLLVAADQPGFGEAVLEV